MICQGPVVIPISIWPNASNTGYIPTGVTLSGQQGDISTSADNQIIDSVLCTSIVVLHKNVTIKRSKVLIGISATKIIGIDCDSDGTGTLGLNCTIQDVEIDGGVTATYAIRPISGCTILRCNVHDLDIGSTSGNSGSNITIKDSFFHSFANAVTSTHADIVTFDTPCDGIKIIHNWMQFDSGTNATGALVIDPLSGTTSNSLIQNNALLGGGQFSLRLGSTGTVSGVQIINNGMTTPYAAKDPSTGGTGGVLNVTANGNYDFVSSVNIDSSLRGTYL